MKRAGEEGNSCSNSRLIGKASKQYLRRKIQW